jgi:hypothetical protein
MTVAFLLVAPGSEWRERLIRETNGSRSTERAGAGIVNSACSRHRSSHGGEPGERPLVLDQPESRPRSCQPTHAYTVRGKTTVEHRRSSSATAIIAP